MLRKRWTGWSGFSSQIISFLQPELVLSKMSILSNKEIIPPKSKILESMLCRVQICSVLEWFGFLLYCMNSTFKSSAICCLTCICRCGCLLWSWKKHWKYAALRRRISEFFLIFSLKLLLSLWPQVSFL